MAREQKPKAANGVGSIGWRMHGGKLAPFARVTLPDGKTRKRIWIPESYTTDERRREFAASCAEKVRTGKITFEPTARTKTAGPVTTVRELVKAWTDGELLKQHGKVNGLRELAGAKINWWSLKKHALEVRTRGARGPLFGDLRVAEVTEQDIGQLMAQHGDGRHATRQKTYRRLHRVFDLAIFPCKLRREGDNPVTRRLRPVSDEAEKVFSYLYPAEVLALLNCARIPEGRRVLYALAVYTGLRKGSLMALRWSGVDFENGTLRAMKTKTKRPAFFASDASLMFLLRLWFERCGRPGSGELVVRGVDCEPRREAQTLRADLVLAGVKRLALTAGEADVEPLRFHDLRATFVTWAKRANRTDDWISERTGHQSDEMMDRYKRAAETLADLRYEPFPEISGAIPELVRVGPALAPAPQDSPETPPAFSSETDYFSRASEVVGASGFEPPTPRPPV